MSKDLQKCLFDSAVILVPSSDATFLRSVKAPTVSQELWMRLTTDPTRVTKASPRAQAAARGRRGATSVKFSLSFLRCRTGADRGHSEI